MAVQNKNLEVRPGLEGVWVDVRDYAAIGDNVADDHLQIEAADTAAVAAGSWLMFPAGTYKISDDMTLSSHCWFAEGAVLSVDATKTVTFGADSKLTAGLYQIFSGSGGVAFNVGCLIEQVVPHWWGATGDGVTDETAAIQAAINAASHLLNPLLLMFPRGRYRISSPLLIDRRANIKGVGFGSQIFQENDVNLFNFIPLQGGASTPSRIANLYLGSAATSAGTSLIYFFRMGGSVIEDITMAGAYIGIHIHGSLFNTIQNNYHQVSGFFGQSAPDIFSTQQIAIYMERRVGGGSCNGNVFINNTLGFGQYGLYVLEGNGEGNFHWYGGRIEQGCDFGMYIEGATYFTIENIHLEGDAGTCGITLKNCTNGRISGDRYQNISLINTHRTTFFGGYYTSLDIDRFSTDIILEQMHRGTGSFSVESSTTDMSHMTMAAGNVMNVGGRANRSGRNRLDGALDVWPGGVPLGFTFVGTGALLSEETSIVRFGTKSAKIQVGPVNTTALLRYDFDIERYNRMDLTNYRSVTYRWIESPSQANEYYVELAGGGDPDIRATPEHIGVGSAAGVLVNDAWAVEGTLGSLAAGEWGYGDNDTLGYDTIYVRLADNSDPDGKGIGYVQARHRVHPFTVSCYAYKPETNGANPQMIFYYGPPGAGDGGAHVIPFDEWTRISRTFFPRSGKTFARMYFGFLSGVANNICYIDGIEIVDGDAVSPILDDSRGLDGDFRVGGRTLGSAFAAFTANDATPNVSAGNNFETANTGGTTITMFDVGAEGQEILVKIADGNTTIDFTGTNLKGNGGVDWSPASGDHLRCRFDGTDWWCDVSDNTP